MDQSLSIDGWGVATIESARRWAPPAAFPDKLFLFRNAAAWTLLVLRHEEQDDAHGRRSGRANVRLRQFGSLDSLEAHLRAAYGSDAWFDVVEAGRDDPDPWDAWVPLWIPRALAKASVYRRDLAISTALLGGQPIPAPGRQLDGWQLGPLADVVARLTDLRFEVVAVLPAGSGPVAAQEGFDNPLLGEVRVRRYGVETAAVVRIDAVGEAYVHLPDDPVFVPVEGEGSCE